MKGRTEIYFTEDNIRKKDEEEVNLVESINKI